VNGDPVEPLTFERAIRQLWERLAANAGISLRTHLNEDDQGKGKSVSRGQREEQLEKLHDDADFKVWSLAVVGEIGAWAAEGGRFRRVPQEAVRDRAGRAADEPWGLYVDGRELASVAATRWPDEFGSRTTSATSAAKPADFAAERRSGRPKGDGYSPKDVPTFEGILSAQRESGNVESQYALVKRFAGDVNSASYWANVDRLRKGLPRWLEKNGHPWWGSI
jgi:hypothetical protein